ncbi:MAG: helix-turn-helix domain-containing protein [Bacteroidota bacterium]|jgi:excisionase family DNA binding protein
MENLILSPITIGELTSVISETVSNEVNKILSLQKQPEQTEYITRKETANILGVSLVTLNVWQKTGLITAYRINTRVRFKRAEVLNSLLKIQTKSFGEVA